MHEYDECGRLVRSVTTVEPRFTDVDRAELIALDIYRAGLCPLCGRPVSVCTSQEDAPGSPNFQVSQAMCRASREISRVKNALTDGGKERLSDAEARLWGTTIREG